MNTRDSSNTTERAPGRTVLILALCVFVIEVLVMVFLGFLPPMPDIAETLLDATLLTVLLTPAFYYFLFHPLMKSLYERERIGEELQHHNDQLEITISERTKELKVANHELNSLVEELRQISLYDPLTGLYNRRYLEEATKQLLATSERNSKNIATIMLDIDHFKKVNDVHGHGAGDDILKALGAYLRLHTRESDIVCRYGGEEFIIVMSDTGAEKAFERCEELRKGISSMTVSHAGETLSAITVSMGIAIYPVHSKIEKDLFRLADRALYLAKDRGRDRVVLSEISTPS